MRETCEACGMSPISAQSRHNLGAHLARVDGLPHLALRGGDDDDVLPSKAGGRQMAIGCRQMANRVVINFGNANAIANGEPLAHDGRRRTSVAMPSGE